MDQLHLDCDPLGKKQHLTEDGGTGLIENGPMLPTLDHTLGL
jgi:hypothetical protein